MPWLKHLCGWLRRHARHSAKRIGGLRRPRLSCCTKSAKNGAASALMRVRRRRGTQLAECAAPTRCLLRRCRTHPAKHAPAMSRLRWRHATQPAEHAAAPHHSRCSLKRVRRSYPARLALGTHDADVCRLPRLYISSEASSSAAEGIPPSRGWRRRWRATARRAKRVATCRRGPAYPRQRRSWPREGVTLAASSRLIL
jgi:hypothetical protein